MKDKSKYSAASKDKWKNKTKEQRSEHMAMMARKRWEKVSPEKRKEHAILMVNKRKQNAN